MTKYPFIYTVETFDPDFDLKVQRESGITFAPTFTKAMAAIEDYYGDALCAVVSMEAQEASDILVIPTEMADVLIHGEF